MRFRLFNFSILMFATMLLAGAFTYAQVINDDIENRITLELNTIISSSTVDCTVQWKCINQELTGKCIKYHNDQWFEFSVPDKRDFYLNLSGQQCKGIWGVQVVIFSGEACKSETHELITCYSDGNKDDIFIRLTGLAPNVPYLLNIDGYLHDRCSFNMELSDTPKGIPIEKTLETTANVEMDLRVATISWEVPENIPFTAYEIYKRAGDTFSLIATLPHEQNSFGTSRLSYFTTDTVRGNSADYKIVGLTHTERLLIDEIQANVDMEAVMNAPENWLDVLLDYNKGDVITLILSDPVTDVVFKRSQITFDPERNGKVSFNVFRQIQEGIELFKVEIVNETTKKKDLQIFEK